MTIIKAIFFSSLIVIPAYLILSMISGDTINRIVLFVILIAFILNCLGVLFIAIPTHFMLKQMNVNSVIAYIFIGFMVPAMFVWLTHPFGEDGFTRILWQGCLLGSFGLLSAFVFWLFAVQLATSIDEQK